MKCTRRGVDALSAVGTGIAVMYGAKVLLNLFGPQPRFAIRNTLKGGLESKEFIEFLAIVTGSARRCSRIRRLKDGQEFYPEYLRAIRGAQKAINVEYYEFLPGRISGEILSALEERARAGVEVRIIVDAVGSLSTPDNYFDGLRNAGGQMRWYHPLRWNTWPELNQRTHRKMLIIDGDLGFMGGAGIADHWLYPSKKGPVWRDTVFCVEGEAVAGMISTFAENWLEASGEILSGERQFGFRVMPEGVESFVIPSTPRGGGTQARILFQALIKSAKETIRITTPYFLPDRAARHALIEAVQKRGVKVQILTAGPKIDHPTVLQLSRRSVRHLIRGGAEVYQYQPAMIHAKLMVVDGEWTVGGSTNFDHRSFALNDEVNLAVLDCELAGTLEQDFADDLAKSKRVTEEQVRAPFFEMPRILADALDAES